MADRIWRGDAVAIPQILTITPGVIVGGRSYGLSINNKVISVVADLNSSHPATDLCAALATAIQTTTIPEWREVSPAASNGVLTLTSRQSGIPFQVQSVSGGFTVSGALVITILNQPSGGTWGLTITGYGSITPAYNASASTLQSSVDGILGSGNSVVTKTFLANGDWQYVIQLAGTLLNTAVPAASVSYSSLTGGNAAVVATTTQTATAGTSEVQRSDHYGTGTGGTRKFSFNGYQTSALNHNASTATVQSAMEALASIGSGNVTVSGTANTQYNFTFAGALAHKDVPAITCDESGITGGSISASIATTTQGSAAINQIYYLAHTNNSDVQAYIYLNKTTGSSWSAGSWVLHIHGGTIGDVDTAAIAYNATDAEIAAAIETAIGTHGVVVSSNSVSIYIQFVGPLRDLNITAVSVISSITGGSVSVNGYATGVDNSDFNFFGSTFTLAGLYGSTNPIQYNATAATIRAEIEALSDWGAGNVVVTLLEGTDLTYQTGLIKIEAVGALAGSAPTLYLAAATSTGGQAEIISYQTGVPGGGANEVQTVTVSGSPSHGSLELGVGTSLATIAYNATAADVQSALIALPEFAPGDIVASGGPFPGTPIVLTFGGRYAYTNVGTLALSDNGLKVVMSVTTPGVTGTNEIQSVSLTGQSVWAGTATLTVAGSALSAINWNATRSDLQSALDTALGSGKATALGGPWPETPFTVEFIGTNAETDIALITATDTLKNGVATVSTYDPMLQALVQAATGPNFWSNPVNWYNPGTPSDVSVPGPLDNVYLNAGKIDILYGMVQRVAFTVDTANDYLIPGTLHDFSNGQKVRTWTSNTLPGGLAAATDYYVRDVDQVTGKFKLAATLGGTAIDITDSGTGTHQCGVQLNKFVQMATYTGKVGLPWVNSSGYKEYRPLYATFGLDSSGSKLVTIGQGAGGGGTSRIHIATGTDQVSVECINTGSSNDGTPAAKWTGSHGSTAVKLFGGQLGIAVLQGESATFSTLEQRGGEIDMGIVTFASWDKTGGTIGSINAATISGVTMVRG